MVLTKPYIEPILIHMARKVNECHETSHEYKSFTFLSI
jgi:hypothetical protein